MSITKNRSKKKAASSSSSSDFSSSDVPKKKSKKSAKASDSSDQSDTNKKKKAKSKDKKKSGKSYAIEQDYKGTKTLGIFNGDEDDHEEGKFPVIAFGITKAKAIVKHIDDIKAWVKSQE